MVLCPLLHSSVTQSLGGGGGGGAHYPRPEVTLCGWRDVKIQNWNSQPSLMATFSPTCRRPAWQIRLRLLQFLILKQRDLRAQIIGNLPQLLFLFLQLGADGSPSIYWCSHGAIKSPILSSVVAVSSPIFHKSRHFTVNNGRRPGHNIKLTS